MQGEEGGHYDPTTLLAAAGVALLAMGQGTGGMMRSEKPLGHKAYGSIPHLIGSRTGPADRTISEGQCRILTERARDKHDLIIVQEKLDGSNVAVAKLNGIITPLIRAGYRAEQSRWRQHHLFAEWVYRNYSRFDDLLDEGERACGEWLAQAHGTRYDLWHEPFVLFDIFSAQNRRVTLDGLREANADSGFERPFLIREGDPMSIKEAMEVLERCNYHAAIDAIEGAVWRVERKGRVDFLAKYVRPDKVDGCYLTDISGHPPVWNWFPDKQSAA